MLDRTVEVNYRILLPSNKHLLLIRIVNSPAAFVYWHSGKMDLEVLQSFKTDCDLLADITAPLFADNLKTTESDVFLNSGLPDDDYNILNLDSFVPKQTSASADSAGETDDAFDSGKYIDPRILLFDPFEELWQSEIVDKQTGKFDESAKHLCLTDM